MQIYKNLLTRKNLLFLAGVGCYTTSFNHSFNQYKLDYEYDNYYKNLIFILIK